jgi:hypothetical protein
LKGVFTNSRIVRRLIKKSTAYFLPYTQIDSYY